MAEEGGRTREWKQWQPDNHGKRVTKRQKRALVTEVFRVIKMDRETDERGNTEAGISRRRRGLLKCSLSCDLSTDAQQEAQETVPSDRVATLLTD